MYSEDDLASAVSAGAISADAAEAFRRHAALLRAATPADEEHFRLVTGFNDIFVTIACALVIFAAAAVGGAGADWLGGLLVAVASWLMAEMFTRQRRMALPSIVLLLAVVIGSGVAASQLLGLAFPPHDVDYAYTGPTGEVETWKRSIRHDWEIGLMAAFGGAIGAVTAFAHWRRFKVAITIAAGIGAVVVMLLSLLGAALGDSETTEALLPPAALICGLAVFAYAMKWDFTDTARKTIKADIAFWLHLLAAPLIAHPLFYWIGVTDGREIGTLAALAVLAVYIGFGVIALAIDRRALLVSALAYVLIALGGLFRRYGAVELNVALTALVIGSALLALSAYWTPIRTALLLRLPEAWRNRMPRGAAPAI